MTYTRYYKCECGKVIKRTFKSGSRSPHSIIHRCGKTAIKQEVKR